MVSDQDPDSESISSKLSRRRVLALTAVGSVGSIAGCSSNPNTGSNQSNGGGQSGDNDSANGSNGADSGGNDTDGGSNVPSQSDQQFVRRALQNPGDAQFNDFSTAGVDWYTMSLMHGFAAQKTNKAPVTWIPLLAKNWNLDGKTFTMELNDGFTWHDGKDVTAEDIVLQYEICDFMEAGKHYSPLSLLDGLPKATGSHTVEMTLAEQMNPDVFFGEIFGEPYWYQPSFFKDYVKRFRNASGENEIKKIRTELTETNLDEPLGFGPLKMKSRDAQKMVFEFHDGYPFESVQQQASDTLGNDYTDWGAPNFDEVVSKLITTQNKTTQAILGGEIDAAGTSIQDPNRLSDGSDLFFVPYLHGQSINFNMWDWGETAGPDWLSDPETASLVRKAFAHAIDREGAGTQLANGNPLEIDSTMTGLRAAQENEWLDQSLLDSMNDWERDLEKAAEYMREAGFTKESGTWKTPDGKKASLTLSEGAGVTRYVNGLDTINSNLQEFGINSEVNMEPNDTYFGKDDNANGTDLGIDYWGGASGSPYGAFDWMYQRLKVQRENGDYDYMLPGEETVEVPPVGKPDSDKTITVDPQALIKELAATLDEKRVQEIVTKLAWATNQSVPQISTNERASPTFVNTQKWEYPSTDDQILYTNPASNIMFHFGVVDAKQ